MSIEMIQVIDSNSTDYKVGCQYVVNKVANDKKWLNASCETLASWHFKKRGDVYYAENENAKTFVRAELVRISSNSEFKAGDLVFELDSLKGVRLSTLEFEQRYLGKDIFRGVCGSYMSNGIHSSPFKLQSLFHATPENRQALVTLHGEDAVPKLPPRGSELTKQLIKKDHQLAMVGDDGDENTTYADIRLVSDYRDGLFITYTGEGFLNAVPVYKNGKEITEVPSE